MAEISIHTPKTGQPKAVCKVDDDGNWYLMVVTNGIRTGLAGSYEGPVFQNVDRGSAGSKSEAEKACREAASKYNISPEYVKIVQPQHAPKLKYGQNELERLGIDPKVVASKLGDRMLAFMPATTVAKLLGFKPKRSRTSSIKRLRKVYAESVAKGRIKWAQKRKATSTA